MEILRNIVLGIMSLAAICVWVYGFASVVSFIRLLMNKGGNSLGEFVRFFGIGILGVFVGSIVYGFLGGDVDSLNEGDIWNGLITVGIIYGIFEAIKWVVKQLMRYFVSVYDEIKEEKINKD